jgi:hypothetical protein
MVDPLEYSTEDLGLYTAQLQQFVAACLEDDGLYEIRPVGPHGGKSVWVTSAGIVPKVDVLREWNRNGFNPYFSLNLRRAEGCRKGADSLPGALIAADFDGGQGLDYARAKISTVGLPEPTAIVCSSPGNHHAYWRLTERLPDLETFERLQRGLAETLGSCPAICSAQQVMRLPGPFCNVKAERPNHPRVEVVAVLRGPLAGRYPVALFPMAAPEPAFDPVPIKDLAIKLEAGSMSDATRALVGSATLFPKMGRRQSLFAAARDLAAREWPREEAVQVLDRVGRDLGLEGPDLRDVRRLVRNAFSTPASPGFAAAETATIDFEASAPPAYDEDLERMPLPEPPPWPDRPDVALGHGLLGDLVGQLEDQTESDAVALAVQFITGFGSIVGRGPHFMVGATRHGANLFATIVGETGKARKGTGLDLVQHVLRFADPHWADECISTNLSSGEGVVDNLRDPVEKPVQDKKTGTFTTTIVDEGVADKRLLVTCTELAGPLRASRNERSTLSPVLREAWDGKTLRTMNKNSPRRATDPHLSLICHVTREELVKLATEADVFGGLFNRFLWPVSRRARFLPHGGDLDGIHGLTDRLRDLVDQAKHVGRMVRTPRANRLWEQVYPGLVTVPEGGILGAVLGRGEAQTLRLSMVLALLAGRDKIDREDLAAALDLWRYCAASARLVFGKAETGTQTRVVEILRTSPGLSRSDLHRRLGWRVEARDLVEALSRLQATGALRRETTQTGGRPSERWFPVDLDGAGAFRTQEKPLSTPARCKKGEPEKTTKNTAETAGKDPADETSGAFPTYRTQEPEKGHPFPDLSQPLKPGTYSL